MFIEGICSFIYFYLFLCVIKTENNTFIYNTGTKEKQSLRMAM